MSKYLSPLETARKIYKEHLEIIGKDFFQDGTYSKSEGEKALTCAKYQVQGMLNYFEYLKWDFKTNGNVHFWQEVMTELEGFVA